MSFDFNYSPFEEDIGIVGMKGSGKSTRAKMILSSLHNIPYWIFDYSSVFDKYGLVVHEVKDLQYGQYIFRPKNKGYETFVAFCNKAFFEMRNLVLVFDELHQYVTKQRACQELYQIVLSGRNNGLSSIFITTRPASIPNWILTNLEHVFAYRLNLQSDIIWLRDFIGNEAWQLLPQDKRRLLQNEPELGKFGFIYRNQADPKPFVVKK